MKAQIKKLLPHYSGPLSKPFWYRIYYLMIQKDLKSPPGRFGAERTLEENEEPN